MPYIAGGIFKGRSQQAPINLLNYVEQKLTHITAHVWEETLYTAYIHFGFYPMESSTELVDIASNKKTILCGRLFEKSTGKAVTISDLNIDAITNSRGGELGEKYWGSYLLITLNDEGIAFYRDPMALSVLFYTQVEQGYVFTTSIAPLVDFLEQNAEVNWTYLTSYIASNHHVTAVTPFKNIFEILPGCETTLLINDKPRLSFFWDPTAISSSYIENESSFQEKIFKTTQMTLSAWVYGSQKAHLKLSGGLDSSSLLALLRHNRYTNPIQAFNFFDSSFSAADEREFAQEVCDLYEVPINFIDFQEHLPFSELTPLIRRDRPCSTLLASNFTDSVASAMNVAKDDIILSGEGGDHLFLAPPPRETFLDYILENNFFRSYSLLKDVSTYNRMPYVSLLRESLRTYTSYKQGKLNYLELLNESQDWMTDAFKSEVDPHLFKPHYWKKLGDVFPGKAQHILAIQSATLRNNRDNDIPGKSIIHPLLSQPLVELALSMPTYQSFKHGYNRFQFRKAMEKHLKGRYLWRISKGDTSGAVVMGVRKNFAFLQSLLLEGQCVKKGFIDAAKLHRSLLEFKSGKVDFMWPIIKLFVVEKWLKSWQK